MKKKHDDAYLRGLKDGIAKGVHQSAVLFCTVLRDKWGWGHIRLSRINTQLNDKAEAVALGYASVKDMEKALNKESGVYFD